MSDLRDEEHRTPIARPQATPVPEGAGESTLKPCPLCRQAGRMMLSISGTHAASCRDPLCHVGTRWFATPAEAAAAWNRRPVEDQQAAEIASMRNAIESMDLQLELAESRTQQQAAEIASLRERLTAVERERDRLIERWPSMDATGTGLVGADGSGGIACLDSDGLWRGAVYLDRPQHWVVNDQGYPDRAAAVRAEAGLPDAGEEVQGE